MIDVTKAVAYVLAQEDRLMSGKVAGDPRDRGGRTRFGVAEHFHPELTKTGYFDKMNRGDALRIAADTYEHDYGVPIKIDLYHDQQIANAMLSFAVNEGPTTAIRVLQRAINLCRGGILIDVDGVMGLQTTQLMNALPCSKILKALDIVQSAHYSQIVQLDKTQACFLDGWMNRVSENCAVQDV